MTLATPGARKESPMRHGIARVLVALVALVLALGVARPVAAAPERYHDLGRAHHAGFPLARSRRDRGHHHAVHGALRAARCAGEANAGRHQHAEPGRVRGPASKDGLTYEFVIRKGVKFHNGEPVTAADVKFSFERYKGAGAKPPQGARARDPDRGCRARRFVLKEPWLDFMTFYGTSATGSAGSCPSLRRESRRRRLQEGRRSAPALTSS